MRFLNYMHAPSTRYLHVQIYIFFLVHNVFPTKNIKSSDMPVADNAIESVEKAFSFYPKLVIRVYARLVFVMFHDVTWSRHRKRAFYALVFRNVSSRLAASRGSYILFCEGLRHRSPTFQ